eukprot:12780503-Alexandrium_andersonii.AAC.1
MGVEGTRARASGAGHGCAGAAGGLRGLAGRVPPGQGPWRGRRALVADSPGAPVLTGGAEGGGKG